MVAAKALEYHLAEAKERQRASGRFAGKEPDGTPKIAELQVPAPVQEPEQAALPGMAVPAPVQEAAQAKHEREATAKAGKAAGVSGRSVASAKYILDHGTEEEIKSVESGKAGLKPVEQQVRARVRRKGTRWNAENCGASGSCTSA